MVQMESICWCEYGVLVPIVLPMKIRWRKRRNKKKEHEMKIRCNALVLARGAWLEQATHEKKA